MISELDVIRRIRQQGTLFDANLLKGVGDDCAVFVTNAVETVSLITTDTLVEGVHFDLNWHPADRLGHKAIAVNLSDIAAMGGTPRFALLSLAAPSNLALETLDLFMQGFMAALAKYNVSLIGGDTVKSDQGLVLSITLIGEMDKQQVVYRSNAKPGDQIWVSGFLGQAAAGLEICRQGHSALQRNYPELVAAHLEPIPEMALGRALANSGLISAMIDMSDGLATDLAHVCEESAVGAIVHAERLPLLPSTQQAAKSLGLDPRQLALAGGEDYRLLFTAAATANKNIQEMAHHAVGGQLHMIGEIVEGQGVFLHSGEQKDRIDFQGYDHFSPGL
ncbi:MAG: thiamine-phosphate kinase [Desulfobulbaceae bacterium]|nr:thiamine-phosphate kinase [Desulfobulbaceae bacterium]